MADFDPTLMQGGMGGNKSGIGGGGGMGGDMGLGEMPDLASMMAAMPGGGGVPGMGGAEAGEKLPPLDPEEIKKQYKQ